MAKKLSSEIVYEDNHLLIVDKPAGILSQGDNTGDESILDIYKMYIKKEYNKPGNVYLGLAHRIDRPVSGLLVMAKTSKSLERMTKMFSEKSVKKTYWAMTKKPLPSEAGTLSNWLIKDPIKNTTRVQQSGKKGAKLSTLDYLLLSRIGDYYLVEITPHTGRSHQIRAQLAHVGCPIVGDTKYKYPIRNKDNSIQLHAKRLSFEHPVKKVPIDLNCNMPKTQLWSIFTDFDR